MKLDRKMPSSSRSRSKALHMTSKNILIFGEKLWLKAGIDGHV